MEPIAGKPLAPANHRVPVKSAISSRNAPVSTRICGRLNWTSRTRNDSSLKRPLWVDPIVSAPDKHPHQHERGAFSDRNFGGNVTRDGELPKGPRRNVRAYRAHRWGS